ncbi:SDR family oxidoreductase [Catellatospora citrea]|uniref:Short-chain dehydrogenase n=1 Tax=Catellatospora citrea TaxID=53366 RepID=A0A8J3KH95_9ACTN|nr:SDR family oxidoreductase [Catellatospora citrea]RKE09815.1 NADP-dependent 3-hydroxy acid dehydrogenase YdfG [Catellatospora citrea]GIG00635.1 short-chain dehydrogenase [Catellatospora citrea]
MKINGSVALVTGANRGLGKAFTEELLARGASKVYATARVAASITDPRVVPLQLDVTDPASVAAAAKQAGDVQLLINNAGIATGAGILDGDEALRREMETNYFGTVRVAHEFAPILAANGGGAIVNVLSALSWFSLPTTAGYSASKSAAWAATNALRLALHDQGTLVTGVHIGYIDTDMAAHVDGPKVAPQHVVAQVLDGVEEGLPEVLADDVSRQVKSGLSGDLRNLYPAIA